VSTKVSQRRDAADQLLSVKDVAEHCGVSTSTIYRMVRDGLFPPPERFGRRLRRWSVRRFNGWVEAGCPGLWDDEAPLQD
jgi:excisionase family DNA binding protein